MSKDRNVTKRICIELAVVLGCMVIAAIITAFVYNSWTVNVRPEDAAQAPSVSLYTFLIVTPVAYVLSHLRWVPWDEVITAWNEV